MPIITSPDGVLSVTVNLINNDSDGVYALQISAISPTGIEFAIDLGANRIWQDQTQLTNEG